MDALASMYENGEIITPFSFTCLEDEVRQWVKMPIMEKALINHHGYLRYYAGLH